MKKSFKGIALSTVLIIIAVAAAAAAAVIYFFGRGRGAGIGAGPAVPAVNTEVTTTVSETETLEYTGVTVSGNEYLYMNGIVTLDELLTGLKERTENVPVKITDDGASQDAYRALTKALDENKIKYISED